MAGVGGGGPEIMAKITAHEDEPSGCCGAPGARSLVAPSSVRCGEYPAGCRRGGVEPGSSPSSVSTLRGTMKRRDESKLITPSGEDPIASQDEEASPASGPLLAERLALSVEEAGALLDISRGLAYDLVTRLELPALRLGRRFVEPRRVERFLDEVAGAAKAI
jgi:hypothetical protein